jgi:acetyl esterase/lipase
MKFLKTIVAAALFAISTAQACTPITLTAGAKGNSICWGSETWNEAANNGKLMSQTLNFYAATTNPSAPLIIYFHPNGGSSYIDQKQNPTLYSQIVQPALAAGYAIASVEFRHPVDNDNVPNRVSDPRVPHWDAARAIQFLRANATALGIDKRNVFVVGHSRGTLSMWTAMQDDMAISNSPDAIARESTRVRAVWAYQGQTSYNPVEFAEWFLIPSDRAQAETGFETLHPKWQQFGSAVASVTPDDPPVHLRYKQQFMQGFISYQTMTTKFNPEHYPDFGVQLCTRYTQVNNRNECVAEQLIPETGAYTGMIDFFNKYLIP